MCVSPHPAICLGCIHGDADRRLQGGYRLSQDCGFTVVRVTLTGRAFWNSHGLFGWKKEGINQSLGHNDREVRFQSCFEALGLPDMFFCSCHQPAMMSREAKGLTPKGYLIM